MNYTISRNFSSDDVCLIVDAFVCVCVCVAIWN